MSIKAAPGKHVVWNHEVPTDKVANHTPWAAKGEARIERGISDEQCEAIERRRDARIAFEMLKERLLHGGVVLTWWQPGQREQEGDTR